MREIAWRHGLVIFILLIAQPLAAKWETIAPGVDYQRFQDQGTAIHVVRADLAREGLKLVATREEHRGLKVSDFAKRNRALVAINGGYFDEDLWPVGLTVSPCGQWRGTRDSAWGGVVAISGSRVSLLAESMTMEVAEPWMKSAVSGWPTLIRDCQARAAEELPGSRAFTHSPHARTAIGLSGDGKTVYLVVAEGARTGASSERKEATGLTLPRLAAWMREQLGVCGALNLDGGGSSALWVKDRIVNRPADGRERRVADHLAIVHSEDLAVCDPPDPSTTPATSGAAKAGRPTRRE